MARLAWDTCLREELGRASLQACFEAWEVRRTWVVLEKLLNLTEVRRGGSPGRSLQPWGGGGQQKPACLPMAGGMHAMQFPTPGCQGGVQTHSGGAFAPETANPPRPPRKHLLRNSSCTGEQRNMGSGTAAGFSCEKS